MTDTIPLNTSRDYDCARYYDLVKKIEAFYADGRITDAELKKMQDMREETLLNYQVAADMLHNTRPGDPHYQTLTLLVDYLRRCWQTMDYATDKGYLVNQNTNTRETLLPAPKKDKKLTLHVSDMAAALVATLTTPRKRRQENAAYIDSCVKKIPPIQKKRALETLTRALGFLRRERLQDGINRLNNLSHTR